MLKIQVADTDVTGGSIPITWCLDDEMINALAEAKIKEPQLVIIVAPAENYSEQKEYRMVVPLKDLIAYVGFHRPGKLNIWAFVSYSEKKNAKEHFLSRHVNRTYSTTLLNSDGTEWSRFYKEAYPELPLGRFSEPVLVQVPDAAFAKEPAQWEQDWVNHFFDTNPDDQCDYRRRRMFAYSLQPLIMLGNIFLRMLPVLIALLIGSRGFTLKYVLHPLTYQLKEALEPMFGGSIFIRNLDKEEEDRAILKPSVRNTIPFLCKKLCLVPFMPPVFAFILFLVLAKMIIPITIAIAIVIVIVSIVLYTVTSWNDLLIVRLFTKCVNWALSPNSTSKVWYENKSEIDLLICDGKIKTLATLPMKKKSPKLLFLDVKSKVCRPFAK